MASLHEYFVKDGGQNLTHQQAWQLGNPEGVKLGELTARLHLDFDANAKYISFFIPEMPGVECPETFALNSIAEILKWPETQVGFQAGIGGERKDAQNSFSPAKYICTRSAQFQKSLKPECAPTLGPLDTTSRSEAWNI
jgi:hypothetical protein